MAVVIRPMVDDDVEAMVRSDFRAFGVGPSDVPKAVERVRDGSHAEPDRFVVADDDGTIVGTGAALTMSLTVPGGAEVPVAGVTWISVSATHRRRGVMRGVMDELVADARRRGEVACGLLASEGSIYANVGYGPATRWRTTEIDTHRIRWTSDRPGGRFRFVEPVDVLDVLPAVHDRVRHVQVGELNRSDGWWRSHTVDGREPITAYVVYEDEDGVDQAYAAYKVTERWSGAMPGHLAEVVYAGAATATAHLALWRFLTEIDLVSVVTTEALPFDDELQWHVADARFFHTTDVSDMLWLRILDVAGFLTARRYPVADELVIEILGGDEGVAGRWRLAGGPDGAKCERSGDAPDASLSSKDLASISMGGYSARSLGAAGRIVERTPGGVDRVAAMFRWDPLPYCATNF
jgi:predicted acetyltransferase